MERRGRESWKKTRGGKTTIQLDPLEEKLLGAIAETLVEGVDGGVDTGEPGEDDSLQAGGKPIKTVNCCLALASYYDDHETIEKRDHYWLSYVSDDRSLPRLGYFDRDNLFPAYQNVELATITTLAATRLALAVLLSKKRAVRLAVAELLSVFSVDVSIYWLQVVQLLAPWVVSCQQHCVLWKVFDKLNKPYAI